MHLSDMLFCCYNLLKHYSIILGFTEGCNYSKASKLHTNCSVRLLLAGQLPIRRRQQSPHPPRVLQASYSCNSGDCLHPPLDIVQSLPVDVGDEVPAPIDHLLSSHSLSFLWSWLLSFSHCGKPLLRVLILCFTLCHRCYRVGAAALLTLCLAWRRSFYWVEKPSGRSCLYADCMSWFMWERGVGNPSGIKIQKTAVHILNYSCGREGLATLLGSKFKRLQCSAVCIFWIIQRSM